MFKPKALALAIGAINIGVLSLITPNLVFAQEEEVAENTNPIEEVHVTGSRIRKANLVSTAPITQVDAEEFRFQGTVRVEDMMRNIPQIYSSQNTGQSNGATGTATINLRNLGAERTLVLVNDRRLPAGSPIQGGVGADINQVPASLIKHTEILTGGASAIYGSDAVAGVVNFHLIDDFEGVQFDYQHSVYRHKNDNSRWSNLLEEKGYDVPDSSVMDGDTNTYSLVIGGNFADDKGNITTYATYREVNKVMQADRDYSACSHDGTSTSCTGSSTIPQGRITDFDSFDFIVDGNEFKNREGETFNYGALNYFQRPDERITLGAFSRYEVNEHAEIYSDIMYMDDRSVAQIAPSGNFFATSTISCGNPLLSDQQFEQLCGSYGLTKDDTQTAFIGRRNIEGGNRQDDLRHTTHRIAIGARGEINNAWSYDIYYQLAEVSMEETYLNDLSKTKIARALDAVTNEDGDIVCRSVIEGYDTDCIPWNIFETGGVTKEQTDYLVLPLFSRGTTKQTVLSGYITGDLEEYGIKIPSAETGISVAVGIEKRYEALEFSPDQGYQKGDGAGQGGATQVVGGNYNVDEWYIEAQIPLIENIPAINSLSADIAYRSSKYDTGVDAEALGLGLGWEISSSVKLRASYQEAVRAANIRELFMPQGLNLTDFDLDPCGGEVTDGRTKSDRTFEECARSGVTEAQFGSIPNNEAGQYNYLQGGSENLKPEEAETFTLGAVFTPSFAEGLSVTLDYYDIEITNGIDNLEPITILKGCLDGNLALCENVQRGASGDLWIGSDLNSSGYITALTDNLSVETAKGVDIIVDYDLDLEKMGSLVFNNVASKITEFNKAEYEGGNISQCSGAWGGSCGSPTMDFRNNFRTTWITPWNLTASVLWRHFSTTVDNFEREEKVDLDGINYFDLSLLWSPTEQIELRLGINNVFDKEPPIAGSAAGSSIDGAGNTFPGVYDALGQYMFAGINFKI